MSDFTEQLLSFSIRWGIVPPKGKDIVLPEWTDRLVGLASLTMDRIDE
jgi:hypothetical protein